MELLKIVDEYNCINVKENIFIKSLDHVGNNELAKLILQYAIFPKNIVAILYLGVYNTHYAGYPKVSQELIRNINEELGVYAEAHDCQIPGPHYSILRRGVQEGLGVEISYEFPIESTQLFIDSLKSLVDDSNIFKAFGALCAIETSAIRELDVALYLVKQLFARHECNVPQFLIDFFNFHINEIEVGHSNRLYTLIEEHLTSDTEKNHFFDGFRAVMNTMENWWRGMYAEIVQSKVD